MNSIGACSAINWSCIDHFIQIKIESNEILHMIDLRMDSSLLGTKFGFSCDGFGCRDSDTLPKIYVRSGN